MAAATKLATDLSIWPPTTFHYQIDDGTWVLVEVDDAGPNLAMQSYVAQVTQMEAGTLNPEVLPKPITYVQRQTVILPATEDGCAISLEPLFRCDPGTSHNDALIQAGYTL